MFDVFRSLRWRLQAWHAIILLLVIAGFGSVLHWEIVRAHWNDVDEELLAAARILEGGLRAVPRPVLESMAQDLGQRRPSEPPRRGLPGEGFDVGPGGGGPRGRPGPPPDRVPNGRNGPGRPPFGGPGRPAVRPREWETFPTAPDEEVLGDVYEAIKRLPRSLPERLGSREGPAYYLVCRNDGTVLREANLPGEFQLPREKIERQLQRREVASWHAGPFREVYVRGPFNTLIGVGRNVAGEQDRQNHLALQLFASGGAVFLLGLLGGWWLSGRAIAPIARMSNTASQVSATNLSERMDLAGVDRELEELGTVLNQMLGRLDEAFQQQRRFTADASHELRTPLAVILSSVDLALARTRSPEEYRDHLQKCRRAATRMRRLVESLLALARLDARPSPAPACRVDLQAVTREALESLEPLAQRHEVTLESDLQPAVVLGHDDWLEQIVTNLVGNAIVYNRPGGRVRVALRVDGSEVVLTVEDTGRGIPTEDLPHLFERFYRVDKARSRDEGGSGLGLAICQTFVVRLGGSIDVRSQVGEGSCFTVQLPRAASDQSRVSSAAIHE